jgi:integrase
MESVLLDAAGHRRSPATMPGYHRGRPPRNKGEQYPADPPSVEEIIAVMRTVGGDAYGERLRALIVLLWRAGLRISEALALQESDLDRSRGAVLVRRGKGGLCRIRHRRPYVAPETMLRRGVDARAAVRIWLGG